MTATLAFRLAATGACALIAAACSSPDTRFYTLASTTPVAASAAVASTQLTVGIGPVTLPGYVNRPQIVIRQSPYAVELAEFDQWAAPLADRLPQVVAENVAAQLPNDRVVVFPTLSGTPVDVQVQVTISQFDFDLSGNAILIAEWTTHRGRDAALNGRTQTSARALDATMPSRIAALSQTVVSLSDDLVNAVTAVRMMPAAAAGIAATKPGS